MKLCDAVKQVESSGNQYAMRFENGLFDCNEGWQFDRTHEIMAFNKCSETTAYMVACTSWGMYQLLGVNVYNCGLSMSVGAYLNDPALQLISANALFKSFNLSFAFTDDCDSMSDAQLLQFAAKWNGPGNPQAYAGALRCASVS